MCTSERLMLNDATVDDDQGRAAGRLARLYTCIHPPYNTHKQTYTRGAPSHRADLTPGPQPNTPSKPPSPNHSFLSFASSWSFRSCRSGLMYVLLQHVCPQMCACAHFIFSERKHKRWRERRRRIKLRQKGQMVWTREETIRKMGRWRRRGSS